MRPGWLFFVLVVMASCRDSRCSLENCRAFSDSCSLSFAARPNVAACGWPPPPDYDPARFCPESCQVTGEGALVECVASRQDLCGPYAASEGVLSACQTEVGPRRFDSVCLTNMCFSNREACENRCHRDAFRSCIDCMAKCGIQYARCSNECQL